MRRQDREVLQPEQIDAIIESCDCLRLGLNAEDGAYIVPLNFAYVPGKPAKFYFHSAKEGRKTDLLKNGCDVGFEMDCGYQLHPGEVPCDCYAEFSSIIGTGHAEIVAGDEDKIQGLQSLMKQAAGKENCEFRPEMLAAVCVFRLEIDKLSCKVHL